MIGNNKQMISREVLQRVLDHYVERQAETLALIRSVVEIESPSGDEEGSRKVVDRLARAAERARCISSIERVDVPGYGQHLVIRAFQDRAANGHVLAVGHTDTVHSRGTLAALPWRTEENRIYAPGVFDMKANCALATTLLHTLDHFELNPSGALTIALVCDEEVGSASGWPVLEKIARDEKVSKAIILEPAAPGGAAKTGRKGTGIFHMSVTGYAAHAGLDPSKGASAILELAKQTVRLHELNALGGGISVNVGVVHGGTRSNVIAANAEAEIDVRFATELEAGIIREKLRETRPFDQRVHVKITGDINRPPLERTEKVLELYNVARSIAQMIEFDLKETQVGGASDGNFLAAMGIPVLDGLGIDGDGAHASHEHIIVDDIPRRGALLTGLIASL